MLRITAGNLKGQLIHLPRTQKVRPSAAKLRAALFDTLTNWLTIAGATVVDLYAGSGALGLEALSRGASTVYFVEKHPRTADVLQDNLSRLCPVQALENHPQSNHQPTPSHQYSYQESHQWQVFTTSAKQWLNAHQQLFYNLLLVDPPYASDELQSIVPLLSNLAPQTVVVIELSAAQVLPLPDFLELLTTKRYGGTQLMFLRKQSL